MTNQQGAAAGAIETPVGKKHIEDFKTSLRGELLFPASEGYEAALKIHNGMIANRPAMVARCAGRERSRSRMSQQRILHKEL